MFFSFRVLTSFFEEDELPSLLKILLLKRFKQSNVYTSRE